MSKGRILVIDDESNIVHPCIKALTLRDYDAQGVSNGQEALELLSQEPFDLLLLDLKMPGMGGLEVLRRAKKLRPAVAAIIITGYGTLDAATEAMQLGAADFVSKPLDMEDLVDKVEQALARAQHPETVVRGNLRSMSLTSIISITCNEGTQASLEIQNKGQLVTIFFQDGEIVHAELNGEPGEEAIYQALGWEQGSFVMTKGRAAPQRTIHTGWSGLLLEGLRRIDEATHDQEALPPQADAVAEAEPFAWPDEFGESPFGDQESDAAYELDSDFELDEAATAPPLQLTVKVEQILRDLADKLDGFVAASVVGVDGVVADLATDDGFNDSRASEILSQLAQQASKASTQMGGGEFEESITATEKYLFVTRPIGRGQYYTRVVMSAGSNIGAARLYVQECEGLLLNALSPAAL